MYVLMRLAIQINGYKLPLHCGFNGDIVPCIRSCLVLVDMCNTYVFYSGDYSAESNILRANLPEKLGHNIKIAIVDAAYHTDDVSQNERVNELCAEIERVMQNKGIALLPLPQLGRAQDIVLYLYERYKEFPLIVDKEILTGFEEMFVYKDWIKNNEEFKWIMESLKRNIIVMDNDISMQNSYGIVVMSDANMQTKRAQLYYEQLRMKTECRYFYWAYCEREFCRKSYERACKEYM